MTGVSDPPAGLHRFVRPADIVEVLMAAASGNPFIPPSDILDRHILTDDIGVLIGGRRGRSTALYVWSASVMDLGPFLAHAASWLRRYPRWRTLHGLDAFESPPRLVLAAPSIDGSVQSAVSLVAPTPTIVRYSLVSCGRSTNVCWDGHDETVARELVAGKSQDPASVRQAAALDPEEIEFFRKR